MPFWSRWTLGGLGLLLIGPVAHAEAQRFAPLSCTQGFAVYCYVDDNSRALGFDPQGGANYVVNLLQGAGVPFDSESAVAIRLSIYSVNLRSIGDPSLGSSTNAVTITLECVRVTDQGLLVLWRDLLYGGYEGVTAQYIINEVQAYTTGLVKSLALDYHRDVARKSASSEPQPVSARQD